MNEDLQIFEIIQCDETIIEIAFRCKEIIKHEELYKIVKLFISNKGINKVEGAIHRQQLLYFINRTIKKNIIWVKCD